jgi:mono/diheme cytochrome c family protein
MTRKIALSLAVLSAGLPVLAAPAIEADARRGAEFFKTQLCTNCHSIRGDGGRSAPDLARRLDRSYTPDGIASRMWDHAPVMWRAMAEQGIPRPQVEPSQAADLFAFFYSVRYFEKAGEAERGKRLFESKGCAGCHALASGKPTVGNPVDRWVALTDPIVLVHRMWNHAGDMQKAAASRNVPLPQLSSQELDDILVYLQNLPETRRAYLEFTLPSPEGGEGLFEKTGCAGCHKDNLSFENRLKDATLTDVAAALWNHSSRMYNPHPELTLAEMRQIMGYVWARQFFMSKGDQVQGKRVFEAKKCATCHNDASSGAPPLTKPAEPFSAISMVSVLWKHGPRMLGEMQKKNISWPQLSPVEMTNLIGYLNSRRTP